MATRRRYIRNWWIEDVRSEDLGRAEIHLCTDKETFVIVLDEARLDFSDIARALQKIHRSWLENVVAVEQWLAPEISANVQKRGE